MVVVEYEMIEKVEIVEEGEIVECGVIEMSENAMIEEVVTAREKNKTACESDRQVDVEQDALEHVQEVATDTEVEAAEKEKGEKCEEDVTDK